MKTTIMLLEGQTGNTVSMLQQLGEDGYYQEIQDDLLPLVFSEFLASEFFDKLSKERRKRLFDQYQTLQLSLSELNQLCRNAETLTVEEGKEFLN